MKKFLANSVFYPCSGLDPTPVRFLHHQFQNFFYVDYERERQAFEDECRTNGFRGYKCDSINEIESKSIFGSLRPSISDETIRQYSQTRFQLDQMFVVLAKFHRDNGYTEEHGPKEFSLVFSRCEAITALVNAYNRIEIQPRCVCYLCPGVSFGGCYSGFPEKLGDALKSNPAGLPQFLFYDKLACAPNDGSYFDLTDEYDPIKQFHYRCSTHGNMKSATLAELKLR